ncbi:MAG: hypothetical protein A3E31_01400 [Candidatus Rokubacteria bacterium RIFCSPHIGHO2_12_FULL_73_22]|nr:MAG: hypothetical protein A3E31_01400 [Candidatus Rokubacteria bacterium RIFCSPHIGHO2_12_FULL_73_22]OGL12792.1 MAG: hypothetical protein A3I14_17360 [Candidatus Rokubacteria bacterium RIFCSPLOWO2_02_FULL_73_56]OGL27319.1 MAG: hypothetical protein A3G44_14045 [Candidatus Rokubacteria bacterium RIFCSPLOWO2_12_FULL_73_47]
MGQRAEVGARGFTLLELLVTLFLIALALGLVAPAIGRSTEAVRARAEVAGFSAALRHARERAITTREPRTVVVEPAAHRLTIRTGDDTVELARTLSSGLAIEALAPTGLAVRFEPHGASGGGAFRLTRGSVSYRVSVDPVTGRVRNARE